MKTITMPYEEYLKDIENAVMEFKMPILELCEIHVQRGMRGADAIYTFEGSKTDLLDELCKIIKAPTIKDAERAFGGS